jgi:hypothetical protein
MTKQAQSLMIVVVLLASSIGCVQFSRRLGRPSVTHFADSRKGFADTQFRYKVATLNLDRFARKELLGQESPPDYYLQAFNQLQKIEITGVAGFQEFNRLQNILSSYHSQRLALGMKARQKTPLQMHRFLAELKLHEDRVAELQSDCFSLLQQKQDHQIAFLFATDSP